jgi:hypothetical protein
MSNSSSGDHPGKRVNHPMASSHQFRGDEMFFWAHSRFRTLRDSFPALRALKGADNDS